MTLYTLKLTKGHVDSKLSNRSHIRNLLLDFYQTTVYIALFQRYSDVLA